VAPGRTLAKLSQRPVPDLGRETEIRRAHLLLSDEARTGRAADDRPAPVVDTRWRWQRRGKGPRQVAEEETMKTSLLRWCGAAVAAGGAAWAVAGLVAGPIEEGANSRLELAGGFVFQIGVLCLVAALWSTDGTGTGRWGRAVLGVEAVLVVLAMGWTVPHLFEPNMTSDGIMAALDAAWPLSMLWLIVQGVTVARARRWPGSLRWLPLVASLWFPVAILASAAGEWPGLVVSSLWLLVTYVPLGVLLMRDAPIIDDTASHAARRASAGSGSARVEL